jgi:hypothetical protein
MTKIGTPAVLPYNYLSCLKHLLNCMVRPGGHLDYSIGNSVRRSAGTIMQCEITITGAHGIVIHNAWGYWKTPSTEIMSTIDLIH